MSSGDKSDLCVISQAPSGLPNERRLMMNYECVMRDGAATMMSRRCQWNGGSAGSQRAATEPHVVGIISSVESFVGMSGLRSRDSPLHYYQLPRPQV